MAKNFRVVTGFRIKYQINCQFPLLLFLCTSFVMTKKYIKPEKANLPYHRIFDILKQHLLALLQIHFELVMKFAILLAVAGMLIVSLGI